jgi:hypothetical protein
MGECLGLVGWMFGHDYVPHFDETPPDIQEFRGTSLGVERILKAGTTRIFRCVVCSRCGATASPPADSELQGAAK